MPALHAHFLWYELLTVDAPGATAFYTGVVGWTTRDAGMPGMDYTLLQVGEASVAGLMTTPEEAKTRGVPSFWSGHVGVDDVDAMTAKVLQGGGKVHRPPADIPGVGRFAVVADPQGGIFQLFAPIPAEPPARPPTGATGTVGWHELHTLDAEAALGFYESLFGWTRGDTIDMGPMGVYRLFAIDGVPVGGMMDKAQDEHPPGWLYYLTVDAIDAAAARVARLGGKVVNGPHQVPGGSWILQGTDPQGAVFALTSMAK